MSLSSKWRLYLPVQVQQGSYFSIGELVMASFIGGPNMCFGGTATDSAHRQNYFGPDGSWIDADFYGPSKAFDGALSTGGSPGNYNGQLFNTWMSPGNTAQWLQYEFPGVVSVAEYGINLYGVPDTTEVTNLTHWELQYWNAGADTWVTADIRTDETLTRNGTDYFVAENDVSPVRIILQQAVEVLRSNGVEKDIRVMQQAVEILRSNGVEAGAGVLDPIPGENPVATTWFMMF